MRRRQRRPRQFLRHERLSVAMALAEALHHSSGPTTKKVVERREGRDARRPTGTGATSPRDAASTGGLSRRGDSGGSADTSTLRFLAQAALDEVRELEEEAARRKVKEAEEAKAKEERLAKCEAKMQVINRRVRDGTATPDEEAAWRRWIGIEQSSSSTSTAQKRKKKKKRKRTRRRP